MQTTIKGTVHLVGEEQQITDKFKKRQLVVFVENTEKPEYSDYIPIDATQDSVSKLDPLKVGDEVEVNIFLGGRKWEKDSQTTVYFPDLKLASVNVLGSTQQASSANTAQVSDPLDGEDDSELPF